MVKKQTKNNTRPKDHATQFCCESPDTGLINPEIESRHQSSLTTRTRDSFFGQKREYEGHCDENNDEDNDEADADKRQTTNDKKK